MLHNRRCGPDVELMIEQVVEQIRCPSCGGATQVKERPVVRYVDLPVYATPMRLAWRKHRMRCVDVDCSRRSFVLQDHRIAAKGCLLTTRAAKWATVQVGGGRTVCEVAAELACDWHTVNDAVTIYGAALLAADRKRLTKTRAIGLDEPASSGSAGTPRPTTRPRSPTSSITRSSTSCRPGTIETSRLSSTNRPMSRRRGSPSARWTCRTPTRRSTP